MTERSNSRSNRSTSNMAHSPGSPDNWTGTLMLASGRAALSVILSVMVGGIMHLHTKRTPHRQGPDHFRRLYSD